ncbi:hypothetical protein Mesci_6208 (plasmid) [Mesorhizobium ciceri biovar biserrulae WSM1271]|uniref:Uncharacterized protein n=1 Tax=Mesorhizobium ciceri biovar biserrulae (strain HAMBI 2942 / LMG 23838 / WSM1271) TaxID=765698 RepID=E8TPG8_MESCW|nr:hypothetical protein Mesci_6208 [Mesorhizobium ciceri biovar biserrulae WSM1271]
MTPILSVTLMAVLGRRRRKNCRDYVAAGAPPKWRGRQFYDDAPTVRWPQPIRSPGGSVRACHQARSKKIRSRSRVFDPSDRAPLDTITLRGSFKCHPWRHSRYVRGEHGGPEPKPSLVEGPHCPQRRAVCLGFLEAFRTFCLAAPVEMRALLEEVGVFWIRCGATLIQAFMGFESVERYRLSPRSLACQFKLRCCG